MSLKIPTELEITPYPTASAMRRAMQKGAGITIKAKYIGIGKGYQTIKRDEAGRALTKTMKEPVAWIKILTVQEIGDYQQQMIVDFARLSNTEFRVSEIVLGDENKEAIAIYGNDKEALISVSPYLTHAFVAINLAIETFGRGVIEIIHQDIPIELINAPQLLTMDIAIGKLAISQIKNYNAQLKKEREAEKERKEMQRLLNSQKSEIKQLSSSLLVVKDFLNKYINQQNSFNLAAEQSVGRLSLAVIKHQHVN